jgi:hypothetical protein
VSTDDTNHHKLQVLTVLEMYLKKCKRKPMNNLHAPRNSLSPSLKTTHLPFFGKKPKHLFR